MSDLSKILKQQEIVRAIIREFDSNADGQAVVTLRGDSGTGKSYISKLVYDMWTRYSDERISIELEGDSTQYERHFYPFNAGLIKAKSKLHKKEKIRKGASELVKGLPFAGDFTGFLLEQLTDGKKGEAKLKLNFLLPEENEIVLTLNSLSKGKELLIIADNFHWWDDSSLKLLSLLLSEKLHELFPYLLKLKILLVITDNQSNTEYRAFSNFLKEHEGKTIKVDKIARSEFGDIISYFGLNNLSKENEDLVYNLTNGHLELIQSLFQFLQQDNALLLPFQNDSTMNERESAKQEFLEKIFSLRLQQLGAHSLQIISLLEHASVIGLHFSIDEVICLTKEKELEIKKVLAEAENSNLINEGETLIRFKHEIIREFFLCRIQSRKSDFYKGFAACLSVLRPDAYFQRANLWFEAGDIKQSLKVYILGCLKCIRDGLTVPAQAIAKIEQLGKPYKLGTYYFTLKEAYAEFQSGKYARAKYLLGTIEDVYDEALLAEKYYLLSLCLPKNLNRSDLEESKNCLQSWDSLKQSESEIWVRIMLTLISRHAHLDEYSLASSTERKVMMFLSERVRFDSSAEYSLNVLRRKASILHISEIAVKRTQASIQFFSEGEESGFCKNPLQYYMALSNHSGNLVVAGEFNQAYIISQKALSFTQSHAELQFPRLEVAVNNYILSGYLSGHIEIADGLKLYETLFNNLEYVEGRILLQNNYIILKALSGSIAEAYDRIEKLHETLVTATRQDSYYDYFVGANRFAIHLLNKKKSSAKRIITELGKKIPNIPDKIYLQKRHELIRELYLKFKSINPIEWDKVLFNEYPNEIGPSWSFFGRGFLFTDMQFWSDS